MGETVSEIMTSTFVSVDPDDPITDAAKTMRDASIGSVMVVDERNQPQGILTRSDFVAFVADEGFAGSDVPATRSLMSTEIVTVRPDASLAEATAAMKEHRIHHLPVVTGAGQVVGVVTTSDLADTARDGFG